MFVGMSSGHWMSASLVKFDKDLLVMGGFRLPTNNTACLQKGKSIIVILENTLK